MLKDERRSFLLTVAITLTEISCLQCLASYPYTFCPDPTRLHETSTRSEPCWIAFDSYPESMRIADPKVHGANRFTVLTE